METISDSIARAIAPERPLKPAPLPTARDCMATSLVTFRPDQPLRDVIKMLLKHRISGGPVIDGRRRLVGVVSEMDCLRAIASGAYDNEPFERGRLVLEVMSRDCITVEPETNVYTMAHLFGQYAIRRLPVVEDGMLVGQVSRRDVLRAVEHLY